MPPWIAQYQPNDKDLRQAADSEFKIQAATHQSAQDWYDGIMPDVLKIQNNPRTGAKIDNNVKLNMFAKRMDRRRDFLFKYFPDLEIDSDDPQNADGTLGDEVTMPGDSDAEDWLEDAWDWNRADTLWGLALLNGGFGGQVYMQCMEPRPGRDKFPRCILLSNVIVVWQADDVDTHLWYEKHYRVGTTDYRQDIVDNVAVGDGANWTIYQYRKPQTAASWELIDTTEWPYELGPIVTWQHWPRAQRCYGAGEFGDIAINTAVNRIMSLGNAVIRNHAFPKTIGTGFSGKKLEETSVDGFWTIDDPAARVYNLEMQSDLSTILNFTEKLDNYYNAQGRTTDIEGGPADFANITNLAIKVSFMPQDDANEILKRQYGYGIVETSKRLQMLAGQDYSSDPIVVWKASLPESKLEIAQVTSIEDTLNLASKETQATQLGLDWLQEQERMKNEVALMPQAQMDKTPPISNAPAIRGAKLPTPLALKVNPITPDEMAAVGQMHRSMNGMSK